MKAYSGKTEIEFPIYRENLSGEEDEIILVVEGRSYFSPGRTYGPPEDCYPDEGETEILKVSGPDNMDWYDKLTPKEISDIEESIELSVQDYDDYDYDDDYDSMKCGDFE